jgi:pilus assembly protein CpaB
MRRRLVTVILFAVIAALVSSTVLYKAISANAKRPISTATSQILVAARDLDAGALIGDADVRLVDWMAPIAPQWIGKREDIVGRGLVAGVNKGEPFPGNRLAPKGAGAGLAARIPPGMRAVAVHMDDVNILARFILPGTRVDVLSTGASSVGDSQSVATRTVLQNIEVLSTGQNPEDKSAAVQVVSLLVTPAQAETLGRATAQNKIQLALRNPLDQGSVTIADNAVARKVTRVPPSKAPVAPAPVKAAEQPVRQPLTVEIIHGTKKEVSVVGVTYNAAEPESGDQDLKQ